MVARNQDRCLDDLVRLRRCLAVTKSDKINDSTLSPMAAASHVFTMQLSWFSTPQTIAKFCQLQLLALLILRLIAFQFFIALACEFCPFKCLMCPYTYQMLRPKYAWNASKYYDLCKIQDTLTIALNDGTLHIPTLSGEFHTNEEWIAIWCLRTYTCAYLLTNEMRRMLLKSPFNTVLYTPRLYG